MEPRPFSRQLSRADIEPEALYRLEEAAVRFGLPYERMTHVIHTGMMGITMIDRVRWVRGSDLLAWIASELGEAETVDKSTP